MSHKISIIMPVKNTAQYLPDCLESIVNQDEINWELMAVDDHSSDSSASIIQQYANADSRIQLLQNQGVGIIHALRTGYQKSSGNFITRMDSDDKMDINKLSTMKQQLIEKGEGHVATGLVKYFSDSELGNGYLRYEHWLNGLTQSGNNFSEIYKECVIPSPSWMMYRSDLEAIGAFRHNTYPEDYDLCFRMYQHGLKVLPSQEILHFWRDYSHRTSRTSAHYADNSFLQLKLNYFLLLDFNPNKELVLWGAGKKGKWLAKKLIDNDVDFIWLSNNTKKTGLEIYGKLLQHESQFEQQNAQYLIAVAAPEEQLIIQQKLQGRETYFFC
jgi:glycosyltransferase involved in cell wall biosynthesis